MPAYNSIVAITQIFEQVPNSHYVCVVTGKVTNITSAVILGSSNNVT